MGLYDKIKDIAEAARVAGNVELYRQVLDSCSLVLEFQNELAEAREENNSLKKKLDIEDDIERHEELFVTRKSDSMKIKYCAHCWGADGKLIQMDEYQFRCPHCKINISYDIRKYPTNIKR